MLFGGHRLTFYKPCMFAARWPRERCHNKGEMRTSEGEEEIETLFWAGAKRRATKGFSEHGHESCQCHIYERIVRRQAWSLADSHDRLARRQPWKAWQPWKVCNATAMKRLQHDSHERLARWEPRKACKMTAVAREIAEQFGPFCLRQQYLWLALLPKQMRWAHRVFWSKSGEPHMVLSSQLLASVTHAVNAHSHSMALEMTELHGFPFEAFVAASTQAILRSFVEQQALLHVRQVERSTHPRQLSTKVQQSAPQDWELPSVCAEEHLMPECLRPQPSGSPDRSPLE